MTIFEKMPEIKTKKVSQLVCPLCGGEIKAIIQGAGTVPQRLEGGWCKPCDKMWALPKGKWSVALVEETK